MKEKVNDQKNNYWNDVRDFRLSRTPFWLGLGVVILSSIGPILLIWIFLGYDFVNKSFNHFYSLPNPGTGYLALILIFGLLTWSMLIVSVFWLTKIVKADIFTYSIAFCFVGISLILNGSWMHEWNFNETVKIVIRFILVLVSGAVGSFIGVIITTFARNWNYKIEEENYDILKAYKEGKEVPTRQKLRIQRAEKEALKREKDKTELEQFKKGLDQKLIEHYDQMDKKEKQKAELIKTKLDAKENKKREKELKKINKKEPK